jgi:ABC-2 type transport system permease protein
MSEAKDPRVMADRHRRDRAALTSLTGIYLAQVAVGVLGVLTTTSEYSTGMIRASLAAVPQQRALLAVRGGVFAVAAFTGG